MESVTKGKFLPTLGERRDGDFAVGFVGVVSVTTSSLIKGGAGIKGAGTKGAGLAFIGDRPLVVRAETGAEGRDKAGCLGGDEDDVEDVVESVEDVVEDIVETSGASFLDRLEEGGETFGGAEAAPEMFLDRAPRFGVVIIVVVDGAVGDFDVGDSVASTAGSGWISASFLRTLLVLGEAGILGDGGRRGVLEEA